MKTVTKTTAVGIELDRSDCVHLLQLFLISDRQPFIDVVLGPEAAASLSYLSSHLRPLVQSVVDGTEVTA